MSSLEPRRPRLLAQNRKLRHLKGISLRNLCFDLPHLQTADDAYVSDTSPRKLQVLREAGSLHPSRSSETLRQDSLRVGKNVARPPQPRRVSLGSAFTPPSVRQKKLEQVLDAAVGDVFFSLHVATQDEPIYISEVREKSAVSIQSCFFSCPAPHYMLTVCCCRTSTSSSSTSTTLYRTYRVLRQYA